MAFCCNITNSDYESAWGLSHELDHIAWNIENASKENKVDRAFIRITRLSRDICELFFDSRDVPFSTEDLEHIRNKFFRLNQKIVSLVASEDKIVCEAIRFLQKKEEANFKKTFESLPIAIQHQLFRKHWELMGEPKKTSEKSYLRKIAHRDFGRVSMLCLDSRCVVSDEQRIRTLEAFLEEPNEP